MVRIYVDPGNKFKETMRKASEKISDFTIPFNSIIASWYKSNRAIFSLVGPGQYEDLSEAYKSQKQKAVGFIYPILFRSGKLARSITVPASEGSVAIRSKTNLILGTSDRVAAFHQLGTKRLPVRPMIFIDAEQTGDPVLSKRREAWVKIIDSYVKQVLRTGGADA